ncbi:M12 family metallo-peptidase [Burkholderia lata]|uniref:Uncharacterized protein n=1 Tax=Burkholderia lata (strain ATCC 17760 / DSM 23089 / LMG 22485 / NCIMB 9086 / R18194 / 383) TaxID=482957 RepID=A0A6P2JNE0_BURL3|nr:M12 family metallo-peptidase [Burkholderia lata]VWB44446.1 hypothetical protein BLA6863_01992 [Burkholderia lata]
MANQRTTRKKPAPPPELKLKSGGAVCKVVLSQRPLRIYFQAYPGITGSEADRALAGIPYKLRIPGQPDIDGQTGPNGQILLPGLQPGLTGELQILGTMIQLRPRDYSAEETTDGIAAMGIQGAKRRLMIMGYYDKPYRFNGLNQAPDDKLDHVEIEEAILQFQVDSGMVPNGEIERHEMVGDSIDTSQQYGFHRDLFSSTIKRFHPDFVVKLATGGGEAPPGTMAPCAVSPSTPAGGKSPAKVSSAATPQPLVREIYDGHRFVPVRFVRQNPGHFNPLQPELDERGFVDGRAGPVVSLMAGETIQVRMARVHVAGGAPLFLKSSDETVVKVRQLADDVVELKGFDGTDMNVDARPKKATIAVHYGGIDGTVLHRLHVEVYDPIEVAVALHLVSIGQRGNPEIPRVPPSLQRSKIEPVFESINKIWRAAGICFQVTQWLDDTIDLNQAGVMTVQGAINEFNDVTGLNRKAAHLNMYVVDSMIGGGIGWGARNTALVAAEQMHGDRPSSPDELVQTFAHEIGHFLGLSHPGTANSQGDNLPFPPQHPEDHAMQDYWSRRSLMYVYIGLGLTNPLAPNVRQRGRQMDIGNGWRVGGKMLCCKVVTKIVSSEDKSEIATARGIAMLNQVIQTRTTAWNSQNNTETGNGLFA